jgi:hypothetical protein
MRNGRLRGATILAVVAVQAAFAAPGLAGKTEDRILELRVTK